MATLIEIAESRPDVLSTAKSQGGDPYTAGTKANTWLNDWWNTAGVKEYAGNQLSEKAGPVSADIANQPNLNIQPSQPTNIGNVTLDKSSNLQSQLDFFKQQATDYQKQQQDYQKQQQDLMTGLTDTQVSAQNYLKQQYEDFGVNKQLEQITQLTQEASDIQANLNNVIAQRDMALIDAEGKPISLEHIRGEQELISRKFDARIAAESARLSSKQATIQAVQGNLAQARSFVNDAVDAMTFDQQQRVDTLLTFMDINRDAINSLDTKYQNAINGAMDAANNSLDMAREDANAKMNLVIDAANYGVTLNVDGMTLEQAQQAYAEKVSPLAAQERALDMATKNRLNNPNIPDEELTDMEYDMRESARLVIMAESVGPEASGEQYGMLLDELIRQYPTLTRATADRMLIQTIQGLKGQTPQTIQQVEENISSDFETDAEALTGTTTTAKLLKEARQKAINAGLKTFLDPTTGEIINV